MHNSVHITRITKGLLHTLRLLHFDLKKYSLQTLINLFKCNEMVNYHPNLANGLYFQMVVSIKLDSDNSRNNKIIKNNLIHRSLFIFALCQQIPQKFNVQSIRVKQHRTMGLF